MPPKRNNQRRRYPARRRPTQPSPISLTLRRHELLGAFPKGGSSDYGFVASVLPIYPNLLTLKNVAPLYGEYRFSYIKVYSSGNASQASGAHFVAFSPTPVPSPLTLTQQQVAQFQGYVSKTYDKSLQARFPIAPTTPWRPTSAGSSDPALYLIFGQCNTPFNQTCASLYMSYTIQFRDPRPNLGQTLSPIECAVAEVPNHE